MDALLIPQPAECAVCLWGYGYFYHPSDTHAPCHPRVPNATGASCTAADLQSVYPCLSSINDTNTTNERVRFFEAYVSPRDERSEGFNVVIRFFELTLFIIDNRSIGTLD